MGGSRENTRRRLRLDRHHLGVGSPRGLHRGAGGRVRRRHRAGGRPAGRRGDVARLCGTGRPSAATVTRRTDAGCSARGRPGTGRSAPRRPAPRRSVAGRAGTGRRGLARMRWSRTPWYRTPWYRTPGYGHRRHRGPNRPACPWTANSACPQSRRPPGSNARFRRPRIVLSATLRNALSSAWSGSRTFSARLKKVTSDSSRPVQMGTSLVDDFGIIVCDDPTTPEVEWGSASELQWCTFDGGGRTTWVSGHLGDVAEMEYNADGQLLHIQIGDSSDEGSSSADYVYDEAGRLLSGTASVHRSQRSWPQRVLQRLQRCGPTHGSAELRAAGGLVTAGLRRALRRARRVGPVPGGDAGV
jgi:hypothetical protein